MPNPSSFTEGSITYGRTFVKPVKAVATVTAFSSAAHRSLFHGVCLADPMQHTDVPTSVRREDRRKKTQRTRAQLLFIARMRRDARSLLLLRFGPHEVAGSVRSPERGARLRKTGGRKLLPGGAALQTTSSSDVKGKRPCVSRRLATRCEEEHPSSARSAGGESNLTQRRHAP